MFKVDHYTPFIAPNAKELVDFVMSLDENMIDNSKFSWGDACKVDRIPLLWNDVQDLIKPSVDYLCDLNRTQIDCEVLDPWVNLYNKGGFQEIHDHHENDFVFVFFANSGTNFSRFFFFDWSTGTSVPISPEPGTIMFFSGKMSHGVSIHNSEVQRRTLSCNFNLLGN
jgi:hypothetical protein|tara:strand:- start:36 stop:539 length:504 start_codon:yes stop_codon:yes gene_type:complete